MRRKTNKELIEKLRGHVERCAVWDLTCEPTASKLSHEDRTALEASLLKRFTTWAETWIEPGLDELEARLCKPRKAKVTQ